MPARRSPSHLRRLSLVHLPSTATNGSGRCPAIATKGWKGSWKCTRCGYEHRALQAGIAPRSLQASVPSLLYNKHSSWFRQMSAIKSASPASVCPCRGYDCRHGIDRSPTSSGFTRPTQSAVRERSDCLDSGVGDPARGWTNPAERCRVYPA